MTFLEGKCESVFGQIMIQEFSMLWRSLKAGASECTTTVLQAITYMEKFINRAVLEDHQRISTLEKICQLVLANSSTLEYAQLDIIQRYPFVGQLGASDISLYYKSSLYNQFALPVRIQSVCWVFRFLVDCIDENFCAWMDLKLERCKGKDIWTLFDKRAHKVLLAV